MPPFASLRSRIFTFFLDYLIGTLLFIPLILFWPFMHDFFIKIFKIQLAFDFNASDFGFTLSSLFSLLDRILTSSGIFLLPFFIAIIPEIFWGRSFGKLLAGSQILTSESSSKILALLYRYAIKAFPSLLIVATVFLFPQHFSLFVKICYGLLLINFLLYFFLQKKPLHDFLAKTNLYKKSTRLNQYALSIYNRIGIKLKIIGSFTMITLCLIFIISILNWNLQRNNLNKVLQDTIRVSIRTLEKSLSEFILTDNPLEYQVLLRRYLVSPMAGLKEVRLIDLVKDRIATSSSLELAQLSNLEKNDLIKIHETIIKNEKNSLQFLSPITYRIKNQDKAIAFLEFNYDPLVLYAPIYSSMKLIATIALYVLIAGALIILIFALYLTKPISLLQNGVKNIMQGNLHFKLEIKNRDELGYLGKQFNEMVLSLREKLEMQKFVSGGTLSAIEGKIRNNQDLSTRKEELTFLFSDIRGFTAMSETMQPEKVISLLNNYFEILSHIIISNNGDIDKYVGDEIFAIFQGPEKEVQAIKAAIAMQQAVQEINQKEEMDIFIGIGINTGEAVLGSMGSSARKDYTAIGDAVNIGARLCSAADKEEIIISESTQLKIEGHFETALKGHAKLKGKSQPLPIYKVIF